MAAPIASKSDFIKVRFVGGRVSKNLMTLNLQSLKAHIGNISSVRQGWTFNRYTIQRGIVIITKNREADRSPPLATFKKFGCQNLSHHNLVVARSPPMASAAALRLAPLSVCSMIG